MATLINAYFTKAKLQEMLNAADKGIAVTIAVNDEANNYQQNVVVSKSQTKDERESKAPKTYYGNGQVVWTDGRVTLAPKKDAAPQQAAPNSQPDLADDLPF
jgi:hypothetical protein